MCGHWLPGQDEREACGSRSEAEVSMTRGGWLGFQWPRYGDMQSTEVALLRRCKALVQFGLRVKRLLRRRIAKRVVRCQENRLITVLSF